jgi:hypothetical protein
LLGQARLPLFLALLAFEPLQRRQKPRRLWLAIDHGDRSFRNIGAAILDCSCRLQPTAPISWFVGNMGLLSLLSLMRSLQPAVKSFLHKKSNADELMRRARSVSDGKGSVAYASGSFDPRSYYDP